MMKRYLFPCLFVALVVHSCTYEILETEVPVDPVDTTSVTDTTTDTTQTPIDTCTFADKIQPIINTNCAFAGCHGSGSGNGDFTSYNGVKAKVDDNDKFETRVLITQDMPPAGPLSQSDRTVIQCWIDNGAQNN